MAKPSWSDRNEALLVLRTGIDESRDLFAEHDDGLIDNAAEAYKQLRQKDMLRTWLLKAANELVITYIDPVLTGEVLIKFARQKLSTNILQDFNQFLLQNQTPQDSDPNARIKKACEQFIEQHYQEYPKEAMLMFAHAMHDACPTTYSNGASEALESKKTKYKDDKIISHEIIHELMIIDDEMNRIGAKISADTTEDSKKEDSEEYNSILKVSIALHTHIENLQAYEEAMTPPDGTAIDATKRKECEQAFQKSYEHYIESKKEYEVVLQKQQKSSTETVAPPEKTTTAAPLGPEPPALNNAKALLESRLKGIEAGRVGLRVPAILGNIVGFVLGGIAVLGPKLALPAAATALLNPVSMGVMIAAFVGYLIYDRIQAFRGDHAIANVSSILKGLESPSTATNKDLSNQVKQMVFLPKDIKLQLKTILAIDDKDLSREEKTKQIKQILHHCESQRARYLSTTNFIKLVALVIACAAVYAAILHFAPLVMPTLMAVGSAVFLGATIGLFANKYYKNIANYFSKSKEAGAEVQPAALASSKTSTTPIFNTISHLHSKENEKVAVDHSSKTPTAKTNAGMFNLFRRSEQVDSKPNPTPQARI